MKRTAIALACILGSVPPALVIATAAEIVRPANVGPRPGLEPAFVSPPDAAKPTSQMPETSNVARINVEPAKPRLDIVRRSEPPHGRVCFNATETREKIATHRLTEPFRALRAGRFQGEALRAKLCRWKPDEFVYEVAVLRRDGRIAHVYMNAQNGQSVGALNDSDRN